MANNITSVTINKGAPTASGQSYTCIIGVRNGSYYGVSPTISGAGVGAINHEGTCLKYIGWPKASSWKSGWGVPSWNYTSGNTVTGRWGRASCTLLTNHTYTFTGTVTIDRGNSRKGTKTVQIGVKANSSGKFQTIMKSVTFETTEIPKGSFTSQLLGSVDPPLTSGTRHITVSATYSNPENYYTAKLYLNNVQVASSTNGTISYQETITKAMFQTVRMYKVILWGKDGNQYDEKTWNTPQIEPDGMGVTVKKAAGEIYDAENMYFKNVNNKEIKEVWVKVNGKIYQTRK